LNTYGVTNTPRSDTNAGRDSKASLDNSHIVVGGPAGDVELSDPDFEASGCKSGEGGLRTTSASSLEMNDKS
jgi:hypothetical protein